MSGKAFRCWITKIAEKGGLEAADLDFFLGQAEGVAEFVKVGGLDFRGEIELAGFAMVVRSADEDDDEIGGRGAVEAEDIPSIVRPVFKEPGDSGSSVF